MPRSRVKSRSHHDVAHIQPLTNVATNYQLPTPYTVSEILSGQAPPPPPPSLRAVGKKSGFEKNLFKQKLTQNLNSGQGFLCHLCRVKGQKPAQNWSILLPF